MALNQKFTHPFPGKTVCRTMLITLLPCGGGAYSMLAALVPPAVKDTFNTILQQSARE